MDEENKLPKANEPDELKTQTTYVFKEIRKWLSEKELEELLAIILQAVPTEKVHDNFPAKRKT
jgi:hypothetical protein